MEILHTCVQARFLLNPSGEINELVLGVLAKGQQRYGIEIYACVVMSNHLHLEIWGPDAERVACFMCFVSSNIAREVGRVHGWTGPFWAGSYKMRLVASDEATLVSRLRYFLAHGCKENLVSRPRDWPGLHPAKMMLSKRHRQGVWVDRSALYRARLKMSSRKRKKARPVRAVDFTERLELELSPLPCWAHLSPEAYRQRIREEIAQIERETAERHRREGTRPLGRRAVLAQHPHHRPAHAKRSQAPLMHSVSKVVRRRYEEAYRLLVAAYREASARLRAGETDVVFPEGTFPPGLPFVRFTAEPRAG